MNNEPGHFWFIKGQACQYENWPIY